MNKKNVCIVSPTYNERENIELLLNRLLKVFNSIKDYNMSILIVDDNSPDRTWEIVYAFCKKYPNVFLLKKENKAGIGVAYVAGFKQVFNKIKADIIFQMDADLSHPPEMIPRFLEEIERGYDLIIGSRYIKGGGCDKWSTYRRIVSRGANQFGSMVLSLRIKDISSGFRCYKSSLLKSIDLDGIKSQGYTFLEELLYHCKRKNAKIKEIPLRFVDRVRGETKLTKREMVDFFITIVRMKFF